MQSFLKNIMSKFNREDFEEVLEKLKKSMVRNQHTGTDQLDSAFVLKVLLEMFKVEKKLKYDYMKKACELRCRLMHGKLNDSYLTEFGEFRDFYNTNFPNRTEMEIIEVYSECYNIGKGSINFDVVYMVMQEYGYLIEDFRMMRLNDKVSILKIKSCNRLMNARVRETREMESKIQLMFGECVANLGLEHFIKRFQQLYANIDRKFHLYQ